MTRWIALLVFVTSAGLVLSGCGRSGGAGSGTKPRAAKPASLRIQNLSGSVVKFGSMGGFRLYGVRLRATVCDRSPAKGGTFPDEIRITHFEVNQHPKSWDARRTVIDRPPSLVPFQESWQGKSCGPVLLADPIPPEYLDAVSLGNPNSCYGVALTITAGSRRASKRAIIQCGGIGTGKTCSPDEVMTALSVVGQVKRLAMKHLRDARFHVTVYTQPSPTVTAGVVMEQEQVGVCKGADVWLTVSTGKK